MPSNKEIEELQKQYPNMRMWGVDFNSFRENPRLGDIIVVPFYDVIDALAACEQRIRLEMYESEREHLHQMRCLTLDAAREAVAELHDPTGPRGVIPRNWPVDAIDALRRVENE